MNFLFLFKKKKINAEATMLRLLLQEKQAKIKARFPSPACDDLVHMQVHNHTQKCFSEEEVFFGKKLAAAYEGLTMVELFKPLFPNERRNRQHRNKLTKKEEALLHETRKTIRTMQLQ